MREKDEAFKVFFPFAFLIERERERVKREGREGVMREKNRELREMKGRESKERKGKELRERADFVFNFLFYFFKSSTGM